MSLPALPGPRVRLDANGHQRQRSRLSPGPARYPTHSPAAQLTANDVVMLFRDRGKGLTGRKVEKLELRASRLM